MAKIKMEVLNTEAYQTANQARIDLNTLIAEQGENITEAARAKAVAKLDEALEALNEEYTAAQYALLLTSDTPVKDAIEQGKFNLYKASQVEGEDGVTTYEFAGKPYFIRLVELEKASPDRIFPNGQWQFWAEGVNHAAYSMYCDRFGIADADRSNKLKKFKISSTAKTLDIGDITTKTGATRALQKILDAILFEGTIDKKGKEVNKYKVDGRHAEALLACYPKWSTNSLGTVVFPTDDTFRQMLMHVFNRVVTGKAFEGDQA